MVSIPFDKFTLSNGLDVILSTDHSLPVTAVNLWYHVGSKNEEPGRTGFAHLFEHVMFEGSKNHNRSFFDPLQEVGANLNGSTTPDRTNYWENVPSNYLELALWLESDRMGFLLDALDQNRFEVQRDVVKNERRQSYENRPYGMAPMLIQPNLFPAPHPYSWTTIGDPADLDAASLDDIKAFFSRYYSPSNASLAIVGDFDSDAARRMVEGYFGDIAAGPPIDRIGRMDSKLRGEVTLTSYDSVQLPRLHLNWPTNPNLDRLQAPTDLLATILGGGKSSRLYKTLVYERRVAREVRVYDYGQEIAGEFTITATANPGHSTDEIETVILEEISRLQSDVPTEDEMARAKNRIEASHVMQLERFGGFGGRADQLNYYNTMAGDPGVINTDVSRYLAVMPEEVSEAASLLGENLVKLTIHPETSRTTSPTTVDRATAPTPASEPRFALPVPRRGRLANNLEVVHLEKRGVPVVAFGLVISGGGMTDPGDKSGLASLTSNMLVEGTKTRTSIQMAEELEFLGVHLTHQANREYAVVSSEALTSKWRAGLAIMTDVALNAAFPEHELDRVRKNLLTDLDRVADNPVAIASRAARSLYYGPGTPYGHPITGNHESVTSITRDDLLAHYDAQFDPGNAAFLVVGDLSFEEAMEAAEHSFGDWRPSNDGSPNGMVPDPIEPSPTRIYLADKPGAAQSVIRAGHLTIPRGHEDYLPLNVFNFIFGGQFTARLNSNLRQDKGYSYGYTSSIDWTNGPSMLVAGGGVQTAVTKEALAETLKEFNEIKGPRPVTRQEFDNARDGILRSLPSQFETVQQVLQQLTRMLVFGLDDDYFATFGDRLSNVSLGDVHRVSDRLDADHLKVLVVGDGAEIESGIGELGLPVTKVDYEGRPLD